MMAKNQWQVLFVKKVSLFRTFSPGPVAIHMDTGQAICQTGGMDFPKGCEWLLVLHEKPFPRPALDLWFGMTIGLLPVSWYAAEKTGWPGGILAAAHIVVLVLLILCRDSNGECVSEREFLEARAAALASRRHSEADLEQVVAYLWWQYQASVAIYKERIAAREKTRGRKWLAELFDQNFQLRCRLIIEPPSDFSSTFRVVEAKQRKFWPKATSGELLAACLHGAILRKRGELNWRPLGGDAATN